MDLFCLSTTVHGRIMLAKVITDPDNELRPEIRHLYAMAVQTAPLEYVASCN